MSSEIEALTHRSIVDSLRSGKRVVVATLIDVSGSAPIDPGAMMLIDSDLHVEGSVTGGCVEAAIVSEAEGIFAGAAPAVTAYGISDDLAMGVGLMCGGDVRIAIAEIAPADLEAVAAALEASEAGQPAAVVTFVDGPHAGRKLAITGAGVHSALDADDQLVRHATTDARALLEQGVSSSRRYAADGARLGADVEVFVHTMAASPRMVVVGAVDFSAALAALAKEVGYRVTICDPRDAFAASARFRRAAEVVVDWPDRYLDGQTLGPRDVVLVFTHDPKLDEPALRAALESGAGFVGALGSRRTDADRRRRLLDAGVARADVERIVCPCGLDIGSATPAETAVSILAEVIGSRSGRYGGRLIDAQGSIRPPVQTVGGVTAA